MPSAGCNVVDSGQWYCDRAGHIGYDCSFACRVLSFRSPSWLHLRTRACGECGRGQVTAVLTDNERWILPPRFFLSRSKDRNGMKEASASWRTTEMRLSTADAGDPRPMDVGLVIALLRLA